MTDVRVVSRKTVACLGYHQKVALVRAPGNRCPHKATSRERPGKPRVVGYAEPGRTARPRIADGLTQGTEPAVDR